MGRGEWQNRTSFAQHAEALGITTDSVMMVGQHGPGWLVLYTQEPTADPEAMIYSAMLIPDKRGILKVARRSEFKTVGQVNAELAEHMERLKGELDV